MNIPMLIVGSMLNFAAGWILTEKPALAVLLFIVGFYLVKHSFGGL